MGESAAAVAIAERVDSIDVGGEAIVDDDVAVLVRLDARRLKPEVVRVRLPPDRQQDMRADRLLGAGVTVKADSDVIPTRLEGDALRIETHRNPLAFEDLAQGIADVLVLARDQPRRLLHHRHLGAEAAVHLCEFQADIAPADHHKVARQRLPA